VCFFEVQQCYLPNSAGSTGGAEHCHNNPSEDNKRERRHNAKIWRGCKPQKPLSGMPRWAVIVCSRNAWHPNVESAAWRSNTCPDDIIPTENNLLCRAAPRKCLCRTWRERKYQSYVNHRTNNKCDYCFLRARCRPRSHANTIAWRILSVRYPGCTTSNVLQPIRECTTLQMKSGLKLYNRVYYANG
jgi:hypothetical protein